MKSKTTSIAGRLFRIIFGSYIAFTLVVTSVQLVAEYRHTEARVNEEIQALRQTFGPGIADAMWRFQDGVLRGILIGMKELPILVGVKVEDESGRLVHAVGTVMDKDGHKMRADPAGRLSGFTEDEGMFSTLYVQEFPAIYTDENGRQRKVGSWTVYSNQRVIVHQVQFGFFLIALSAILKTVVLWFIFLFVVQRWLGTPLTQLSNFLRELNIDNLGERVFVLKDRARHELHFLADALNNMAHKLRQSIEQNATLYQVLQREQTALRVLNETLEQRVEERTAELQKANLRLEALSTSDGLTGIANRRRFDDALVSEWQRAARTTQPLALAMLDLDWFKNYNDHYGHQAGDDCLRTFAHLLETNVRRTGDVVARYGGEEFTFIAPATDAPHALSMAQTLCDALAKLALPHQASPFGIVTVSIGVAVMVPQEGETADVLVKMADEAMYRAKVQGRNRVVLSAAEVRQPQILPTPQG